MPNILLTADVIAREALMVLEANMVMGGLVHRDYDNEFVAGVGDTVTIRKPAKFVAHNFTDHITRQDASEGKASVKLDHWRDVSFDVTSRDLTMNITNFSEQFIAPAMRAIAQALDEDILNEVVNVTNTVNGTANATDLKDIANISKKLDINKVPQQLRRLVFNPEHKYRYATTDNLSKASYAGDSQALREANLGRLYTLDTFMDQNAPYSLAETPGTLTECKATGTKDTFKVALSSVKPATGTLKEGDGLIIDGRMYRVKKDVTAASGAIAEVELDMPLMDDYDNAAVYPVTKVHSLAFHRNTIVLVTRTLDLPLGNKNAAIMSNNGLGVRVVFGYNQETKTDTVSLDVLYGIKTIYPEMAVKLIG